MRRKIKGVVCGRGNPVLGCRKQFTPSMPFGEKRTLISVTTPAGTEQISRAFLSLL